MTAQLARFVVVGAANTLVSYATFVAGLTLGVPYIPAAMAAFAAGAANGYAVNRRWTFNAPATWRSRVLYIAIQGTALAYSTTLVWMMVELGAPPRVAYALAIPPVTLLSFVASRSLAFRPRDISFAT